MEQLSSDTNVWLDFWHIKKTLLPFKLEYVYLMSCDAVQDELLNPPSLKEKLLHSGLQQTQLTTQEFYLSETFAAKYIRLSRFDSMALAIAYERKIVLLTGDKALRKAAQAEGVRVIGTIAILDQLLSEERIDVTEYICCINKLKELNGTVVRLPQKELDERLHKL